MRNLRALKTVADWIFLTLFVTIVSLPLLTSLKSTGEEIRRAEKRKAVELPDLEPTKESISSYPKRFESFYDDKFGLREQLIYLHSLVKVFVFEVSRDWFV